MASAARHPEERNTKSSLILAAAYDLFLAQGFDAVSTDLIAKTAGVSKATLYAHFSSKEALFSEILLGQCAEFSSHVHFPETYDGDLAGTLRRFALDFTAIFESERGISLYRLIIGEVHRFPEIALAFEAAGPSDTSRRLMRLLRLIAEQFLALLTGRLLLDRALGLPRVSPEEIARQVDAAVTLFLRGYATAPGPR